MSPTAFCFTRLKSRRGWTSIPGNEPAQRSKS